MLFQIKTHIFPEQTHFLQRIFFISIFEIKMVISQKRFENDELFYSAFDVTFGAGRPLNPFLNLRWTSFKYRQRPVPVVRLRLALMLQLSTSLEKKNETILDIRIFWSFWDESMMLTFAHTGAWIAAGRAFLFLDVVGRFSATTAQSVRLVVSLTKWAGTLGLWGR